ncbi:MAG: Hsp20/alpha crystallin family protein [Gammaproteobacteria bacterium]|nr:MAG: Hsp20/alpha crystallin family protein [Gammaproteobacteria bacterium]UCH39275.1 MAG: Hsp20/alpha crystallin family protein [Gammaproteobacteria bacterium]
MNMQLWNPFQDFENMLERYSKSGLSNIGKQLSTEMSFADWSPSVDIEEEEDKYVIKADLPGVEKEDIEVKLENNVLSIRGEKKTEKETGKGTKRHRTERFHGTFARSFTLPETVKADEVDASYKDGVLLLTIPKEEESKPKSIDIKVS